jgi:hypothetical protein
MEAVRPISTAVPAAGNAPQAHQFCLTARSSPVARCPGAAGKYSSYPASTGLERNPDVASQRSNGA